MLPRTIIARILMMGKIKRLIQIESKSLNFDADMNAYLKSANRIGILMKMRERISAPVIDFLFEIRIRLLPFLVLALWLKILTYRAMVILRPVCGYYMGFLLLYCYDCGWSGRDKGLLNNNCCPNCRRDGSWEPISQGDIRRITESFIEINSTRP